MEGCYLGRSDKHMLAISGAFGKNVQRLNMDKPEKCIITNIILAATSTKFDTVAVYLL